MPASTWRTSRSRVALVGAPHWAKILADLLAACGIDSDFAAELAAPAGPIAARLRMIAWSLRMRPSVCPVIHHVWVSRALTLAWGIACRRIPQIMHWIGSDVLYVKELNAVRRRGWVAQMKRLARIQLADSPELAAEVADLGLPEPRVVRLLPRTLRGALRPMPEQFAALSYWSTNTFDFYKGDIVLRLAAEFPQVPFYIVGRCTAVPGAPPNVHFVGWVEDMDPWYDRTSVLIRLPPHDSVSVMVLEMLARGRHAIYSRPFPHCRFADSYETARQALIELQRENRPNLPGPDFVNQNFNPSQSIAALRQVYTELGLCSLLAARL